MLVYLDIDGVMIPARQDPNFIPPDHAKRLRRILDQTGAKLVITSHRRVSRLGVLKLLLDAGFTERDLSPAWSTDPIPSNEINDDLSIRGQEIAHHIARTQTDQYVILDDFPMLASQACRHVQPDENLGLTDVDADVAISILKGDT